MKILGTCVTSESLKVHEILHRYLRISSSFTLSENEKVEQYIRIKIHKSNILRF